MLPNKGVKDMKMFHKRRASIHLLPCFTSYSEATQWTDEAETTGRQGQASSELVLSKHRGGSRQRPASDLHPRTGDKNKQANKQNQRECWVGWGAGEEGDSRGRPGVKGTSDQRKHHQEPAVPKPGDGPLRWRQQVPRRKVNKRRRSSR